MLLLFLKCVTVLPFIVFFLFFLSLFLPTTSAELSILTGSCLSPSFTVPPGLKAPRNTVGQTKVEKSPEEGSTVIPLPVTLELPSGLIPGSEIMATLSWTGLGERVFLEVAGLFGDVFLHVDINQPFDKADFPPMAIHADFIGGTWSTPDRIEEIPLAPVTLHKIIIRLREDQVFEFWVDQYLVFTRKPSAPYHPEAATKVSLWCEGGESLCVGLRGIAALKIPEENLFDFASLFPPKQPTPPRVFVGVLSAPQNSDRRQNIRKSYLRHHLFHEKAWALKFFVGRAKNPRDNELVEAEAQLHGDLVVDLALEESYRNITRKTLAILEYGSVNEEAEFVFKADDDTFIHVDRVDELLSPLRAGFQYIGKIAEAAGPIRVEENKWYMSFEEWPDQVYPPFAFGSGYLVSNMLARSIVEGHKRDVALGARELRILHLEDVAVGTWVDHLVQRGLQVEYIHHDEFPSIGCVQGGYIAHNMEHHEMACMWQKLSRLKEAGVEPRHRNYCCGAHH